MSYNRYKNTQKRKNYLLIHNKEKYDRVSIILPKGTKEKIKRGCEEMRIHFFTAPFLLSLFTPGSKKQEKKGILPPFPQNSAF